MISTKKTLYKLIEAFDAVRKSYETVVVTTGTISSLPYTYSDSSIKSYHTVVDAQLSNPSAQTNDWTVNTSDGSVTISGRISGSTTLTLKLTKSA